MNDTPAERGGDSTWARLRRRKVVQWSVAYVAAAWALLQGLEFLADIYDWPTAILRVVTLALALGLPIAVTLAWYHGDRGEQRVGGTELTIVAVLFLLGGGVVWYYQRTADTSTTAMSAPTIEKPLPTDASIAVLPFVNMSPDKDQEYFADGISEELLNLLAQVPELRVIARTSSFSFKGKEEDIADIARTLNVANILEGSVRKSGARLRITAQLVRASDSSQVWSQTYDRQIADVFVVQDEIAAAVVNQLKVRLLGEAPNTRTTNPQAYARFLQAREITRRHELALFEQAIELYQQALAIDPNYAPAWDGLAETHFYQADYGGLTSEDGLSLAREAIGRALTIDPRYAPAYARAALIEAVQVRDLASAARHVEQGLALDPANLDVISVAVRIARVLGRLDQAISLADYAVTRDPVNIVTRENLAAAYALSDRFDEAILQLRAALKLSPGSVHVHEYLGEVLLWKGDPNAALAEIEKEPSEIWRLIGFSLAYCVAGRKAESDAALNDLIRKYERTAAANIAYTCACRGETERTFTWLEKAVQYHDPGIGRIVTSPQLSSLHSDRRWLPLLRRLGLAPEQLAAIKFDVKVPK